MNAAEFERRRLNLFREHGFPATGRMLREGSGRDTYVIEGGAGSKSVVMVHGGLSESSQWFMLAGKLRRRVFMADRPGCGLSYAVDYRKGDYFLAASEWTGRLLDALELEKATLVANSMGGYFALAFALTQPERVEQLVLVGAPAGIDRYIPPPLRIWGNRFVGPLAGRMIKATRSAETLRRRVFPWLVAHPGRLPVSFLEIALAARKLPGADVAAHTMLRAVLDAGGWRPDMSIRDRVASLNVPTDFVWGERDAFAPPSSGEDLASRMPDARLQTVPDAGHLPFLDDPEATSAAIMKAIDRHGKARGTGGRTSTAA